MSEKTQITYNGSEYHKLIFKKARKKGRVVLRKNYEKRIEDYNQNPKLCLNCNEGIEYKKKVNKFCSHSCAAITINKTRKPPSEEQKKKISLALKGHVSSLKGKHYIIVNGKIKKVGKYKTISYNYCKICGNLFTHTIKYTRITCSKECNIIAIFKKRKYQNGGKNLIKFFNPFDNKDVYLESSWELKIAKLLIEKNIKWTRPKPIKWKDNKNKEHYYFPDFYLKKYDLYLDPKNPYCMNQDKEKMKQIKQLVSIEYGNIDKIINFIENLKKT